MAVLGPRFCARAFSSCGKRGPPFIAVRGPLTVVASLAAEHRLQMRRLSNCGSWAQLLPGMWDLPRPGLEPVSPALAGRFSTTAPPGKPYFSILNHATMDILIRIWNTSESISQSRLCSIVTNSMDSGARLPGVWVHNLLLIGYVHLGKLFDLSMLYFPKDSTYLSWCEDKHM